MREKKFIMGQAIRFGWDTMKENIGFLVLLQILIAAIFIAERVIQKAVTHEGTALYLIIGVVFSLVVSIAFFVWNNVVSMGLTRIALNYCDKEKATWSDLFSCIPLFFKYVFTSILYSLIVIGGTILLVVPGIIWAMKFSQSLYFVIDKGLGPMAALRESSRITMGAKWDLFLFGLLLALINLLGALCLLIGLFATIPTTLVAGAYVYRKLLAYPQAGQPAPEIAPSM
ncbi:MAG: hypothetical protein P8123_08935 [bacterium]